MYGSSATETPSRSLGEASAISPALSKRTVSTAQTSNGAQSPNVAGVDGSVDIRYGSPAPANSETSVEKQQ
jgi:BRCT domain type II-containing protein